MSIEKFINKIICGDSLATLKELPDNSIDLVITSPPYYNQRAYDENDNKIGQESTVEEYINNISIYFGECIRIIKPTGSVLFNMGDKYIDKSLSLVPYKFAIKMKENYPDIILLNNIIWLKPNPQPRQFKRRLVSSHEPFFHFVKSDKYKYYPEEYMEGKKEKKITNGKNLGKKYFEDIKNSNDLNENEKKQAIVELKEIINEVKEGKIWSFRMKIRGIHSAAYGGYEGGRKAHIEKKGFTIIRMYGGSIKRDYIVSPIIQNKYLKHPAIYPEFLVEQFIKLLTEPGDIVLDPFIGSGTTAVVAKRLNRKYIGIDILSKYCLLAEKRLEELKKPQVTLTDIFEIN